MNRAALFRAFAASLLAVPLAAAALEGSEFHLYGINAAGTPFDLTPDGERYQSFTGDPHSKEGFRGPFVNWKAKGADDPKQTAVCLVEKEDGGCLRWGVRQSAATCTVWLAPSYRISCAAGKLPLSGVTYAGEKLERPGLRKNPEAERLYKSFLRKYAGARPGLAAVYRCKEGCTDPVPPMLLFMWLGD